MKRHGVTALQPSQPSLLDLFFPILNHIIMRSDCLIAIRSFKNELLAIIFFLSFLKAGLMIFFGNIRVIENLLSTIDIVIGFLYHMSSQVELHGQVV